MVVLGSAWLAASWTSRSGTPASSAAVMNAWRRVWGRLFGDPCLLAIRRTIRAAPCRSRRPVVAVEDGPFDTFADREVDRSGGARRERHDHDLAAFADHREGAVPALESEVFDIRAGRFGDTQSVQREE